MSKARSKAKRQRNAEFVAGEARSRTLPEGVPADARFCNETVITDRIIRQACSLTVPPTTRLVYLLVGIGIGVAGVLGRIFLSLDTLALILLLVLGFTFVWQSMHLGMDPARRMMRQFAEAGSETRHHIYFATDDELGFVLYNGTVRSYPWSAVDEFAGTKDTFILTLKERNPITFIIDAHGFTRGSAEDFVRFAYEKVVPEDKGRIHAASSKMFRTLDRWNVVKAQAKAADAQRKASKRAARAARRGR